MLHSVCLRTQGAGMICEIAPPFRSLVVSINVLPYLTSAVDYDCLCIVWRYGYDLFAQWGTAQGVPAEEVRQVDLGRSSHRLQGEPRWKPQNHIVATPRSLRLEREAVRRTSSKAFLFS